MQNHMLVPLIFHYRVRCRSGPDGINLLLAAAEGVQTAWMSTFLSSVRTVKLFGIEGTEPRICRLACRSW